jgi:DNA polymerase I
VTDALSDVKLHVVTCIDDLLELKRWAGERRETPMGVDTESGDLSPWHSDLRLIQLGDKRHGWAIPWDRWGGAALEILNAYEGDFVMHNSSHDLKFMITKCGYRPPWHRIHDTMTLAALDNPVRPKGLKSLANRLVSPTASAGETLLKDGMARNKWTWATVPLDFAPYFVYSALDPVLTVHLWEQLHPRVNMACPDVYDLERATIRICTNMMINGMRVDLDYVRDEQARLNGFALAGREWLEAAHKITSPLSAGQISRAFVALGEEIHAYTKGGAPQMDKEALTGYKASGRTPEARQLAEYVLAVRHSEKLVGTYLSNFAEMVDSGSILHCTINPLAARTSRMSVSSPSLQNLPRNDKAVRGAFVPRDGNAFVSCDLAQVEARLSGSFSKDPGIVQAFYDADHGGQDFFCGVAERVFGERIQKSDRRRDLVKGVVYGFLFSAGAPTMARTAGVPLETMQPVVNAFMSEYPGLRRAASQTLATAKENGSVVTLDSGRKLPLTQGREGTQAFNTRIQGTAAEYLKRCTVEIDAAGLGDALRLLVHDEAIIEVPKADAEEALRTVEQCMTDTKNYLVPLLAEGKVMEHRWQK